MGWLAISVPSQPQSYNGVAFVALFIFCIVALVTGMRR